MKNLILIFCLWAAFASCSDDETKTEEINPYLPVTALEIPRQQSLGQEIVLHGKGFASDCKIQMQSKEGDVFDTEVVTVGTDSVVIKTPELKSGFYILILQQGGKTFRIGGINLVAETLEMGDIEALGIVGEENFRVYPVSLTDKMKGERLFSAPGEHSFYGGVISQGVWYYATFYIKETMDGIWYRTEKHYVLYAYDLASGETKVLREDTQDYVAMGLINDEVHIFTYNDENCYIEKLENGTFHKVHTFPNADVNKKIVIWNGIFLYDVAHNSIVMSGQDMTGDTRKLVWSVNLDRPAIKEIGGETSIRFNLVDCNGTFYAFGMQEEENKGANTYVVKLDNPSDWTFANLTPEVTLKGTYFDAPVFDKEKNLIYGIDDGETIISYDITTKQLAGGKWVKSGLTGLFLLND